MYCTGRAQLIRTRLIRSSTLFKVSVKCFPIISCLKCMVNLYFHLFRRKSLQMNDFELTAPDLYFSEQISFRFRFLITVLPMMILVDRNEISPDTKKLVKMKSLISLYSFSIPGKFLDIRTNFILEPVSFSANKYYQ